MHSPDLTQQNLEKIRAAFPNCVTEARDAQGNLKLAIDFDLLKQELADSIVEGPQERYRLDWPGKREAMLTANAPIAKTLRPARDESVNFDETENLFIEGDNLDALKLLQESYLGKVKMIYIDPPYNRKKGNDLIYKDDFVESTGDFKLRSNQVDASGNRLIANTESNGRFHSDWLSMIFPRLKLAANILREDGVIFISIDDNEQANLKRVCDEVFGEDSFLANIIWEKVHTRKNSSRTFSVSHEHILAYAKSKELWDRILLPRENNDAYKNPDNHPKGPWKLDPITAHNEYSANYEITKPNGVVLKRPEGGYWRFSEQSIIEKIKNDEIVWGEGSSYPMIKRFLSETQDGLVPVTIFDRGFAGDTSSSKKELDYLFEVKGIFEYTKPTLLLKRLMQLSCRHDDIVLDFFAGTSSTAHAALLLNSEDGGNRKFIMVQIPEENFEIVNNKLEPKKGAAGEAYKAGYKTIAEISKERIRRAGQQILEGECHEDWNKDVGFRVLKVDTSNMKDVYYNPNELSQADLIDSVDHIKDDRSSEDLLFQVLLDWGVDLTLPIRREKIHDKEVFIVDENALVACFDDNITEELVNELADLQPLRVIFRDTGFSSDSIKINATQTFKQRSPMTEVKSI